MKSHLHASLACTAALGLTTSGSQAFTVEPLSASARHSSLSATVYGSDGYISSDDGFYNNNYNSYGDDSASTALMERISSKCTSSLSRLACAFCPSNHNLRLQNVESSQVVEVDANHVLISAVLCEKGGCVQVAVPIDFPHSCGGVDDVLEECILDNMEQLDHQAHELIRKEEWKEDHMEELADQKRMLEALMAEPAFSEMPLWWTHPELAEGLAGECGSIKSLLNEDDFSNELLSLAHQQIHTESTTSKVHKACVASLGPAGLLLRAQIEDGTNRFSTVVVPIQFSQIATSAEGLRASVLGLVSSVS